MAPDEPGKRTPGSGSPASGGSGVGYSPLARPTARRGARVVERIAVLVFRSASAAAARIPAGPADRLVRVVFRIGYHAWPPKRRIIHRNAARILRLPEDDPAVGRLARAIYTGYGRFTLELLRLPHAPVDEPLRLLPGDGGAHAAFLEAWDRASARGTGVIAVSGHIGSIDLFAGAYALRGYPTYGLADDTAFPELFDLLNRQRSRWGLAIIPWRNLREIFRVMRAPAILGMVVDWGYRPDDLPVRLFGTWTTLPAGPATLAARSGAIILPVASIRQPDGTYRSVAAEAFDVPDGAPATILAATQRIADALESLVRPDPRQWFAFKPLWPATRAEEEVLAERAREIAGG